MIGSCARCLRPLDRAALLCEADTCTDCERYRLVLDARARKQRALARVNGNARAEQRERIDRTIRRFAATGEPVLGERCPARPDRHPRPDHRRPVQRGRARPCDPACRLRAVDQEQHALARHQAVARERRMKKPAVGLASDDGSTKYPTSTRKVAPHGE